MNFFSNLFKLEPLVKAVVRSMVHADVVSEFHMLRNIRNDLLQEMIRVDLRGSHSETVVRSMFEVDSFCSPYIYHFRIPTADNDALLSYSSS